MLSGAVLITLNMIQRMFSLYPNIFPNYTRLGLKEKKKALRNSVKKNELFKTALLGFNQRDAYSPEVFHS